MDIKLTICCVSALLITAAFTAIICRFLIPKLKSLKLGQKILDVGPRWHKSKEGTPTMGGISFIAAALLTSLVFGLIALYSDSDSLLRLALIFGYALLNGCIGVMDDLAKFSHGQNEGLKAWQKYLLQLIVTSAYLAVLRATGIASTSFVVPFIGINLELGIFWYVISVILCTGIVNSVNLTDGVDGLCSTVTAVIGVFFFVASFVFSSSSNALASAILVGCCLGFLVYNFHPARIFMGDTGSLFLGGWVIGLAYNCGSPLIILIAGMLYVLESLSVIIQVSYFKLTHGKRFFKMSPIHHHFEKSGWGEIKVVTVFSTFTLIVCVLAFIGL